MTKKWLASGMAAAAVFGLTACGGAAGGSSSASSASSSAAVPQGKVLVAYFSASGNTKRVAEKVAAVTKGDLYEIVPAQKYTSEDLNYHNDNCRANVEMRDAKSRPAISGSVSNMADYQTIFIGYPIWWGTAPRIIDTFVESYDFTGKKVIPFATSGGSGISTSEEDLAALVKGGTVVKGGLLLSPGISEDEIRSRVSKIF